MKKEHAVHLPRPSLPVFVRNCLAVVLITGGAALALPGAGIVNPHFDTILNGAFTVTQSQADTGWYGPSDGTWTATPVAGDNAACRDPSVAAQITNLKSMLQIVTDGKATTGTQVFGFDAASTDTGMNNRLTATVYGVDSFGAGFTTGGNAVDANAVPLATIEVAPAGLTYARTRFSVPVEMGAGYNFLVFRFTSSLSNGSSSIAVDNVTFAPPQITPAAFPFPHAVEYAHGMKPTNFTQVAMNNQVQQRWEDYKSSYLTQAGTTPGSGEWRVARTNQGGDTVSEGIGYGMLLCVLMDNAGNDTQPIFDGLYSYYKHRLNANGLMRWHILPNGTPDKNADAADADEDVAMSLVFADRQWGSDGAFAYLTEAQQLINRLKTHVCQANSFNLFQSGSMADGDSWTNISYYSPAWYKVFGEVTGSTYWTTQVVPACYADIDLFYSGNPVAARGLVPNWHKPGAREPNTQGPDTTDNAFTHGYDACRVGWRIGLDYLWNGTTQNTLAYQQNFELAKFMNTATGGVPTAIRTYEMTGALKLPYNELAFTAPVGVAAMVSDTWKTWRNQIYSSLVSSYDAPGDDKYYGRSLQLLSMLTLSGNFPDLTTREPSLVTNGGFEDGVDGWTFPVNGVAVSANMNSGLQSARITANGAWSSIHQDIPLTPDTGYEFQGYVKTTNLSTGALARLQLRWLSSTGATLGSQSIGTLEANKGYTHFAATPTSPGGAATVRIELILDACSTGAVFFDDIQLRPR